MKYVIVHDMPGRIRVRCGKYAFSLKESISIEYILKRNSYIEDVEASYLTGSILVYYKKDKKDDILESISKLTLSDLPLIEDTNKDNTKEIDIDFQKTLINMIGGKVFMKLFVPMPIRKIFIAFKSAGFIKKGIGSLVDGKVNVDVLDATSITAALSQRKFNTASSIMFLLNISGLLEEYTKRKTKSQLKNSLKINVDSVWLANSNEEILVPLSQIQVGDKIMIHTGNMIPVDGVICDGEAMINQSTMTGEPLAVRKSIDDFVYAGTVIEEGTIKIEVKTLNSESRISKIVELIDNSEELKASIQGKAEKLADKIVPFSLLGAAATYLITRNVTKALSILLVDYSCAIKLSTPISIISAMREASTNKIMIKGGKYLEELSKADTIVFDKTGTLTVASPEVEKVVAFEGFERDYVLKTAACLEEHFPHSVARAIVKKAAEEELYHKEEHAEVEYVVAHGIASHIDGKKVIVGSSHFVFEDEGVKLLKKNKNIIEKEGKGYSIIYLAIGDVPAGFICIKDPVREEAKEIIERLKNLGIKNVIMLTGDGDETAERVSKELGINKFYSQVLPEDKSNVIEGLKNEGHTVIMVGDGVNDSPALAAANVSVAMKDGSDIAREVADITLMESDLRSLIVLRELSVNVMKKISKNYRDILVINTSLLLLGVWGWINPTTAALFHNISTMLISAKSMKPCLVNK